MNPPCTDEDDNGYTGSEPLDAALADRFAFVVEMPTWEHFTQAQQLAIIRAAETPVQTEAAKFLRDAINRAQKILAILQDSFAEGAANYVQTVVALLAQAGLALSPRRANMLYRGVLALNAAALAMDPDSDASDATLWALRSGLPQRAQGITVSEVKLLGAHREAFSMIRMAEDNPLRAILCASHQATKRSLLHRCSRHSGSTFVWRARSCHCALVRDGSSWTPECCHSNAGRRVVSRIGGPPVFSRRPRCFGHARLSMEPC